MYEDTDTQKETKQFDNSQSSEIHEINYPAFLFSKEEG